MSKKDYIVIAKAIIEAMMTLSRYQYPAKLAVRQTVIQAMCDHLAGQSETFNPDKFGDYIDTRLKGY